MLYVLALHSNITDQAAYDDYVDKVRPIIVRHGGSVVASDDHVLSLEGKWPAEKRAVIVTFPSTDHAHRWYKSPEYNAIKELRLRSVTSELFFIHGIGEKVEPSDTE